MTSTVTSQIRTNASNATVRSQVQATHAALVTGKTGNVPAGKPGRSFAAALLRALSAFVV
jgi:hypothetical protein